MMSKSDAIGVALKILQGSGLPMLWENKSSALGAILCFHHVLPSGGQKTGFSPNHQLEISPEYLEALVLNLKSKSYRFIAMDEVATELRSNSSKGRFVCFTFDDGYRDNALFAVPILRKHNVPYTIYVTKKIVEGTCELWWRALEHLIASQSELALVIDGISHRFSTASNIDKTNCANKLYPLVKAMDEHKQRRWIRETCTKYNIDNDRLCRDAAMDWSELRELAKDPLCTIGAHTVNHFAVRKLGQADAENEINESRKTIERELNMPVKHFAYPYGDRVAAGPRDFSIAKDAGFLSSVTTRKGLVFPAHRDHLHALPRLMISGRYQTIEMFETLLSGLPFALINRFRKVDVA